MVAPEFVYEVDPRWNPATDADLDPFCRCGRMLLGPHDYVCKAGHVQRVGRPPKGLRKHEREALCR